MLPLPGVASSFNAAPFARATRERVISEMKCIVVDLKREVPAFFTGLECDCSKCSTVAVVEIVLVDGDHFLDWSMSPYLYLEKS